MKRHVLFIGYDDSIQKEIKEFLNERGGQAWFSQEPDRSIRILDNQPIDAVVLLMKNVSDASILNYINLYHSGIQVIISTSNQYAELITVLSRSHFQLLSNPMDLKELNDLMFKT